MKTTVVAYAALHKISLTAARRRLQKLVDSGKATRATVRQKATVRGRGVGGAAPYTMVVSYTIEDPQGTA